VPIIARQVLRQQIASGDTAPLYVLEGDDEDQKSAVVAQFVEMVDEGIRAFNVDHIFAGEQKAVDRLLDASATLPMMAPRRIVIVHNAERLLIPKREGEAAEAEQERLETFVSHPPAHATVVFASAGLDRRRRLIKLLDREAQWVKCGSLVAEAEATAWLKARAEREKVPLDASAVRALIERSRVEGGRDNPGPHVDLVRLRTGFDRVALYAMGQPKITGEEVAQVVALNIEARPFGIANAIEAGDAATALKELARTLDGGATPFVVLGQLRWVVEDKVSDARKPEAMDAVLRTDLALKSSGDASLLLERLVVELCAGAGRPPTPFGRAARH